MLLPLSLQALPAASQETLKDVLKTVTSAQKPTRKAGKEQVDGYAAVAQYILSNAKDGTLKALLGDDDATKAEVYQWIEHALVNLKGEKQPANAAKALNDHLATRSFLVGYHVTLADIFTYAYVHAYVESAAASNDKVASVPHLVRWFDLMQHSLPHAKDFRKTLDIALDNPLLTPKPAAAKPDDGAKAKKSAAQPAAAADKPAKAKAESSPAAAAGGDQKKGKEKKQKDGDDDDAAAQKKKEERKALNEAKKKGAGDKDAAAEAQVDPSRLDVRVGFITACKRHDDAETLYVEQIDVGEEAPRTVVSGLVNHIPLEEMQKRYVVVLCNLKPVSMRGVKSHAMVLATTGADGKVELLVPPKGSKAGEKVSFETFSGTPDEVLNPKKKTWEGIQPHLKTADDLTAGFLNPANGQFCKLVTAGGGVVKSSTVKGGSIK
ncbi:G4 quadruplex nucleic acid binding protein [Sorochytrium milnesiophthora]